MKLGILGVGNMGGAILEGYSKAADEEILIFDADNEKLKEASAKTGAGTVADLDALIKGADTIIIALKPNIFDTVIPQIADAISKIESNASADPNGATNPNAPSSKVIVSIAAGISIEYLQRILGNNSKVVRVMPNTPAMVGEGMAALSASDTVTEKELTDILNIFKTLGKAEVVDEPLMDTVTGISGSSPAYAYMYIQALMECGIKNGMKPEDAKTFAAQSTLGAAKMVLDNDISPEQLRINVCSPGGTTIEAVNMLEQNNFIDTVKDAMDAAIAKSTKMTKK